MGHEEDMQELEERKLKQKLKLDFLNWTNRRKMAWTSLISTSIFTLIILFFVSVEKLTALQEPIGWFYITNASVVGAYMGFTTYLDAKAARRNKE